MPAFEPFRALRFAPDLDLTAVTAPPYDVLSDADVDALESRDPSNIVHVDVPRGGPGRYGDAAANLARWVGDGVLVADDTPTLTIYRRRFTDATGRRRDLSGVLGAIEVVDDGAGGVLAHERTTPKASTDRLELTRATQANLSPVWCLTGAARLSELLEERGEPVGSLTVDGVEHVVERVADPARIASIAEAVAEQPALIADGHHRYAVSRQYRDEVRARTGRADTPAERTLAFVGQLVAEQLSVEAIHRVYRGVPASALRDALAASFEIADGAGTGLDDLGPHTLEQMEDTGRLVLLTPDGWSWLAPRDGAFDGVRSLDGAWLEHALAAELADVLDVAYQHGLDETVDAVRSGVAQAAVLIRPVSVAEIERTAREGLLMPPKSTYFTPKLRTGLVVRDLRG